MINVFDMYYGTTHDGPGMRTTFFLKGCPLHCKWCHNPEGISPVQQIWWDGKKCIGCLTCQSQCTTGALSFDQNGIHINRKLCSGCKKCAGKCPAKALSVVGEFKTTDQLVHEAEKCRSYFDSFKGGVTVSGGEPLLQADEVAVFLKKLHESGISTAVDTCGCVPKSSFDAVIPYTDYFLFDVKLIDNDAHKQFTGAENLIILNNLRYLVDQAKDNTYKIWIRTPLIPNATATEENVRGIAKFLLESGTSDLIERWELCAFNNVCINKYQKLELQWAFDGFSLMNQEEIDVIKQYVEDSGFPMDKLVVSGLTATPKH